MARESIVGEKSLAFGKRIAKCYRYLKDKKIEKFDQKTLKKLKRQFTRRSNKEIKKVCEGDRQTQKELKKKIKELLDGIQIKE